MEIMTAGAAPAGNSADSGMKHCGTNQFLTEGHRMIFRGLVFSLCAVALVLSTGCGRTEFVNTATLPDNYLCAQMKDICKEAREFESAYAKLSPADRKEAENILKGYRMQCADALDQCKKSAKKK